MQNQSAIDAVKSNPSKSYLASEYTKLITDTVRRLVTSSEYSNRLDDKAIINDVSQALSRKAESISSKPQNVIRLIVLDYCKKILNNHEDIVLLNAKSQVLIEKYQYQTLSIIKKYELEGTLDDRDVGYMLEDVNGKLSEKLIKNTLSQYKKGVLFRTYFYKITENVIKDELRKKAVRIRTKELDAAAYEKPGQTTHSNIALYASTFGNLLRILLTKSERRKFELCIKIVYRLVLSKSDIIKDYPFCSKETLEAMLGTFGKPYLDLSKGDLWEHLNENIGKLEDKNQSVRTLKDWVDRHKILIIENIFRKPICLTTVEQKNALDTFMELIVYHFYKKTDDLS